MKVSLLFPLLMGILGAEFWSKRCYGGWGWGGFWWFFCFVSCVAVGGGGGLSFGV